MPVSHRDYQIKTDNVESPDISTRITFFQKGIHKLKLKFYIYKMMSTQLLENYI